MRKKKTLKVGEQELVVKELTVAQVEELLKGIDENRPAYMAELLMDSALTIEAVSLASGLSAEALNGDYTPNELQEIWGAAAEVNDFLSRMLARMIAAAGMLPGKNSAVPSAE